MKEELRAAAETRLRAGRMAEAEPLWRALIALDPHSIPCNANLGGVLEEVSALRRAVSLAPEIAELHDGLATLEQYRGRPDRAISGCCRALALLPDRAETYSNLGNALRQQGALPEAESAYRRAAALNPDYNDARLNLSLLYLLTGRFREGWPGYEDRWTTRQLAKDRRHFAQPLWRGEAAAGKTLLLHAEQGFGDTLQFCRYAALARARGMRVVLEVQPPLRRLLQGLEGCETVLARGDALPPFDLHCPMLSMPLATEMENLADIPATHPYVRVAENAAASWAERVSGTGRRVGLAWAGAPRRDSPVQAAFDRRRSLSPAMLAPLLALPGIRYFSLQKDGPAASGLTDFMGEMADFADTAALIANLDLVISVDTAIAHLAGAMGKPVWLLNRFDSCWRWLTEGSDTPWYPTMRIFRQQAAGDWENVIAEVMRALA